MQTTPPDLPGSGDAPLDPIELAAAEWLVRRDRGLDPILQREFERWLRSDPRHAEAYALLVGTWEQLDRVPADRVPLPRRRGPRWTWIAGSLAAAAALTLAVFTLAPTSEPSPLLGHRVATPIGGFERLALPDGSVVRLNTASEVTVDFTTGERRITLTRGEASFDVAKDASRPFVVRVGEVEVRAVGTAFNVRRQDHAIEVLVTHGLVRLEDVSSGPKRHTAELGPGATPSGVIRNTPAAGSPLPVSVEAAANDDREARSAPLLGAGQRATIMLREGRAPSQPSVAAVDPAEAARTLAWRSRRLEFSAEPLANIAAEFNRYNHHRLVIADAELGARRFGGKFPADDFETLVRLLETSYGVVVERRKNETVLRLAPAGG